MRLEDVATSPHFTEHAEPADPERLRPDPETAARLVGRSPRELAELVENPAAPLAERLAAGGVLAVVGDPRITPVPAVCAVPGGTVEIGLAEDEVEETVRRWAHVGVVREWIEKETPVHHVTLDDY